ncbi:ParB/RepB/Spo0J family partition protein [Paucibacter sp. B2R-40]|uniref:ParB/RepB/Spo0J family partition protein n=1 Tax=Paucibacter sp. B2R-40 TaxID=2893554 RepID=UPI0021E40511|nr:ParB/RepB/Spo0J family partition protein [Paucibacter sp. B2R-40]MCV2354028.1 ParB/RepB/Spo0J family partition protein [Paucibacter sp. B2R-40]
MALQLDDLALLEVEADVAAGLKQGTPLILPIGSIDEDPAQPRHEFDLVALQELADTITLRGVRQPVSVRPHPDAGQAGRWMLNFGARRLRASKLAGKLEIPAFVDVLADSYDQVIENEQREGLKPLELALFVQERLRCGETQADVARRLGKSRQYVTRVTALIEAPQWLLDTYRAGRCRGMNELYELRKLHAESPVQVETWVNEGKSITRDRLQLMRASLLCEPEAKPFASPPAADTGSPVVARAAASAEFGQAAAPARAPTVAPKPSPSWILQASLDGEIVSIVVDAVPEQAGWVFVWHAASTSQQAVKASRLALLGFVVDPLSRD